MHTWLTVAVLTRRLGRPASTIRLWRDTYDVPQRVNDDGHQTYPLEILEAIKVMRAEQLTPREIAAELDRRYGEGDEPPAETFQASVLARLDRIIVAVERIADHLATADPKRD